jgi:hypothetical protein
MEGVVLLPDGSPLAGATVQFVPEEGGRPAHGLTGDDGSFRLTTFSTGDGAKEGDYKVVITPPGPSQSEGGAPDPHDPEAMKKAMIGHMKTQKRPGVSTKKGDVHANYTSAATTPLRQRVPAEGKIELKLSKSGN